MLFHESTDAGLPSPEAEAARYALLRRLAPSMRHHLVVNLQPIGMIYEVMERRLRGAQPDLAHVQESASKINGFARAALNSCIDVVSWLAPDDSVAVAVQPCVRECTALLATSFSFRGYALRNEVEHIPGQVRRSAVRTLVTGALIFTTDHLPPSTELVLTAEPEDAGVVLGIATRENTGDKGFATEPGYRKLQWHDLQALAAAEGAAIDRDAGRITIRLPWVQPA
jgi:hypothetical protein